MLVFLAGVDLVLFMILFGTGDRLSSFSTSSSLLLQEEVPFTRLLFTTLMLLIDLDEMSVMILFLAVTAVLVLLLAISMLFTLLSAFSVNLSLFCTTELTLLSWVVFFEATVSALENDLIKLSNRSSGEAGLLPDDSEDVLPVLSSLEAVTLVGDVALLLMGPLSPTGALTNSDSVVLVVVVVVVTELVVAVTLAGKLLALTVCVVLVEPLLLLLLDRSTLGSLLVEEVEDIAAVAEFEAGEPELFVSVRFAYGAIALEPGAIDFTDRRLKRCEGRRSKLRLLSCCAVFCC